MSDIDEVSAEVAGPVGTAEGNGRGSLAAGVADTLSGSEEPGETELAPEAPDEAVPAGEAGEIEAAPGEPTETGLSHQEPGETELAPGEPDEVTAPAEAASDEVAATPAGEEEPGEDEALGFEMPPAMSQMIFVDVVLVLPSTHPVLVLQEAGYPYRELRIPIGGPEGIAIGYASRQLATPRPLTHELMTRLIEGFGLTLEVVRITGLQGGTYTAEIVVSGPEGQRTLDCRPSDAVALALRQAIRVPIVADPDVLDRAGGAAAGQN